MMKFIIIAIKSGISKANSIPKILITIIGMLFLYSLVGSVLRYRDVNYRLNEARVNLEKLNEQNEKLLEEVSSVKTIDFIEKEARDKLGLAYENEYVLVLPDEDTLRKLSPRVLKNEESALPDPNWKKWWSLFF